MHQKRYGHMRRKSLAAVVALVVGLAACGSDEPNTDSTSPTADSGASPTTDAGTSPTTDSGTTPADTEPAPADTEPAPAEPSGTLRYAFAINFTTFDPALVQNQQRFYIQPLYDNLLRMSADNELEAGLAEAWEWDGTTATLTLREGAVFHDGTPIDSEAVRQNIERFAAAGGPQVGIYRTLESVAAPDPQTVVLTFNGPAPGLLVQLTETPGMILNPAAFDDPSLETMPSGTSGPYELDPSTSAAGDKYVYVANDSYWDPSMQGPATIELLPMPDPIARSNALQSGEIDITPMDAAQVDPLVSQGFGIAASPGVVWGAAVLDRDGTQVAALADPRVRQAMSMAIDREAVAEGVFFGHATPASQLYLPGAFGHVAALDEPIAYDPDGARALLAEAGFSDISFIVPTIPTFKPFAEAIASFWTEIGINATVELAQAGGLAAAVRGGGFPVFVSSNQVGDPNDWYNRLWSAGAAYNTAYNVVDETVNDLASKAATPIDEAERQPGYDELFTYVLEESIFIPVVFGDLIVMHSKSVSNVVWPRNDYFPNPARVQLGG